MVRFCTVAACPSPEEPALSATIHVVAPYAAPPANTMPAVTEMIFLLFEKRPTRRWRPLPPEEDALDANPDIEFSHDAPSAATKDGTSNRANSTRLGTDIRPGKAVRAQRLALDANPIILPCQNRFRRKLDQKCI
jgi:hypothetical protein